MRCKKYNRHLRTLLITCALCLPLHSVQAQVKLQVDTLECHIVSFSTGLLMPGGGIASSGVVGGNMADLYTPPYLDFALEWDYKYQSNWLLTFDADLWFGLINDNLTHRTERLGDIVTPSGIALSWGGYDGNVAAYNRNLAARAGVAKLIPVSHKNPNSGLLLKLSGGWIMQKTVFHQEYTESPVPQLHGDYLHLYDHYRNGIILTESIGFSYMSNYISYVNFKIAFEFSQCMMWSSRPYQLDGYMGLHGKDYNHYLDLMYGLRLTWMFPLTGKTTYDYYYY